MKIAVFFPLLLLLVGVATRAWSADLVVTSETASIKQEPDPFASNLTTVNRGQRLKGVALETDWWKVQIQDNVGYIHKDVVKASGAAATEEVKVKPTTKAKEVDKPVRTETPPPARPAARPKTVNKRVARSSLDKLTRDVKDSELFPDQVVTIPADYDATWAAILETLSEQEEEIDSQNKGGGYITTLLTIHGMSGLSTNFRQFLITLEPKDKTSTLVKFKALVYVDSVKTALAQGGGGTPVPAEPDYLNLRVKEFVDGVQTRAAPQLYAGEKKGGLGGFFKNLNQKLGKKSRNTVVQNARFGELDHGALVTPKSNKLALLGDGAVETTSADIYTHPGIDLVADKGTPIYPISSGTVHDVINVENDKDFSTLGYSVIVEHDKGDSEGKIYSLYTHMAEKPYVEKGQRVFQGYSKLGVVGSTGATDGKNELHMEIRRFPGRYLGQKEWGYPRSVMGKGDLRASKLLSKYWINPARFKDRLVSYGE